MVGMCKGQGGEHLSFWCQKNKCLFGDQISLFCGFEMEMNPFFPKEKDEDKHNSIAHCLYRDGFSE